MKKKKGLLIILSGPSGVGKGTVRREIIKRNRIDINYSISMTTRSPREGEIDGVDYYFVSKEAFLDNIKNDNFLEYAEFVGNYYGTPKSIVEKMRDEGKNVFLEIEIKGATQVLERVHDDRVISFFLMPPNAQALEDRIRKRKTESEDIIKERLDKGISEMKETSNYDYVILNDDVARAADEIIDLILKKEME